MKVVERKVEPGKWRIGFHGDILGHEITAVYLKGLRNRPWPLYQVAIDEFKERFPDIETDRPRSVVRGMPSMWTQIGPMVYVWPAPAHEWVMQVRMTEKAAL